jgi:hypothetical protein
VSAHGDWLDQFEEGNAAGGHAEPRQTATTAPWSVLDRRAVRAFLKIGDVESHEPERRAARAKPATTTAA